MGRNCETIGRYVSELYRTGNMFLAKKFKKFNIGVGQYLFLLTLYRNDGICQEELSSILKIDKGTTAKAIKKLEQEGYIWKKRSEKDRRECVLGLTDKALDIKEDFFKILDEWNTKVMNSLEEEEGKQVVNLLKKILLNDSIRED